VFVTSLPLLLLNAQKVRPLSLSLHTQHTHTHSPRSLSIPLQVAAPTGLGCAGLGAGLAVWALGFYFEAMADYQKWQFRQDPLNKGRFITTGLWEHSRHPNYFGEILMWWGVFAAAAGSLPWAQVAAASASPLFVSFLLMYVSGVPLLEKSADEKWGDDPSYQAYKAKTHVLLPIPRPRTGDTTTPLL
jgi:steroid 5-alpha reductase family enzyme